LKEGSTDTQEETSSNRTTQGDELNVAGFETSRDITILFSGGDVAEDIGCFVDLGASSSLEVKTSANLNSHETRMGLTSNLFASS
jgi:hypothetical protein